MTSRSASLPVVLLRPYIRRLIVTAQVSLDVMRIFFFGGDWQAGVGCIYKQERAIYLSMAKSSGWALTKAACDILPDEHTPFSRPLRDPLGGRDSSSRVAMEWMVGA